MTTTPPAPICETCDDTHTMSLEYRDVPCTRCPLPCRSCATGNGVGAYCTAAPCACACHEIVGLRGQIAERDAELDEARKTGVVSSAGKSEARYERRQAEIERDEAIAKLAVRDAEIAALRAELQPPPLITLGNEVVEIFNAIGRPLTQPEITCVATMADLTPSHAGIVRTLLRLRDSRSLCRRYLFGIARTTSTAEVTIYLSGVETKLHRETAALIDPTPYKLVHTERLLALEHAPTEEIFEISPPEIFAVQHSIEGTIRCQLNSFPGGVGVVLFHLIGKDGIDKLVRDIAGNVVHSLV